jgi:hypothetical protein
MGRWSYSNRSTVEECKSISTKFLNQYHHFDGGISSGGMNWSRRGEKTGSIGFTVSTEPGDEYIRFQYTHTDNYSGEKSGLDYRARLTWTPCYYGGRRWWFICPLIINAKVCSRRVGILYLGGGKYFGCRHCFNLTYESCKESHTYDRLFRKLGITAKRAKELFK